MMRIPKKFFSPSWREGITTIAALLPGVAYAGWMHVPDMEYVVNDLATHGDEVYAATWHGVLHSPDNGRTWEKPAAGTEETEFDQIAIFGNDVFAWTDTSVYLSKDQGKSWTWANSDWRRTTGPIYTLSASGDLLFAGAERGLFVSRDSGTSWSKYATLPQDMVQSVTITSDFILTGSPSSGIFRSPDKGTTWIESNSGFSELGVTSIAAHGKFLFAATTRGGIYRSSDSGNTWSTVNKSIILDKVNFPYPPAVYQISVWQDTLFALIDAGQFQVPSGVYRSTDDGTNWVPTSKGLSGTFPRQLVTSGPNILVSVYGNGIMIAPHSEFNTGIRGPSIRNNAPGFIPLLESRMHPGSLVSFATSQSGWVEAGIFNAKGNRVENLYRGWTGPGLHTAVLNGSRLTLGRYYLILEFSGNTDVHPFLLEP